MVCNRQKQTWAPTHNFVSICPLTNLISVIFTLGNWLREVVAKLFCYRTQIMKLIKRLEDYNAWLRTTAFSQMKEGITLGYVHPEA